MFDYDDNQYQTLNNQDSFVKAFVGNMCLRPSCYDYLFKGLNRVSDFTLGDFWSAKNEVQLFYSSNKLKDSESISELLIITEKGKELLDEISNQFFVLKLIINKFFNIIPS